MFTRKFVFVMVVMLVVVSVLPVFASAETDIYPKAAVVVEMRINEFGEVIVTVEDGEGFLWDIFWELDEETDIELGDVLAMLMWDAGTPDDIFDDEVIDVINEHFKAK